MHVARLAPVLAALVAGVLLVPGAAEATTSTGYYAADGAGNLVHVTVTDNQAGHTTVVHKGNPETQQTSPAGSDGDVVVGLVADINAGTTTLFTYNSASGQFYDLSPLGKHISAATVYDDGARIAYSLTLKHRYAIRSVPATGGTATTLFSSRSWSPYDLAVSENGARVYFSASQAVSIAGQPNSDTHRSNVFVVTTGGKKRLEPTVADPLFYTQIQLSPDGTKLAVVRQRLSGSPRASFTIVNLSTGHVRIVLKSYANPIAGIAWAADGSSLVFRDATGWARVGLYGRIDAIAKTAKLTYPVLASS